MSCKNACGTRHRSTHQTWLCDTATLASLLSVYILLFVASSRKLHAHAACNVSKLWHGYIKLVTLTSVSQDQYDCMVQGQC